ncbi:hypothetical protein PINS_up002903 [Pythium insidiosum]|nr:hypothetical protein PINS_up002903 [Pythium insidiosum]
MLARVLLSKTTLQQVARRSAFHRSSARAAVFNVQLHAFSTTNKPDDRDEPMLKTVEELIAENEALKKEVAELKKKAQKPGLMGTIKEYGMPFFFWWTGLYLATGVGFYAAFDSGLLNGGEVIDVVMSLGLDRFVDADRLNPTHGNLALAIIVNEIVEPIRFPFALATIPHVKKLLSRNKAPENQ